ncbi:MAG: DNA polymerase III subunit delta' [Parvibaculaceae bacterium]
MSELPEPDRLGDFRHPRDTSVLYGHDAAEKALLDAFMSGRLHHAWLFTGPKGVGKATLAYRMAKFVLTYPDAKTAQAMGASDLSVSDDMPAVRQIVSRGHPDLLTIRRPVDEKTKKPKTVIPVDEVRKTTGFFGKSSGAGGWRICIVDSADEMNPNAANALLKVLEEPPERCLFLLVSHQPGRLLPTIRSRCRQLPLAPLGGEAVAQVLADNGVSLDPANVAAIETLAEGSAGRALTIADGGGLELYRDLVNLLCRIPRTDIPALHALADKGARRGADQTFEILIDLLRDWVARAVRLGAGGPPSPDIVPGEGEAMMRLTGAGNLDRWVEVWEKIGELATRAEALNMDRKLVILNAFSMLEAAAPSGRMSA